MSEREQLAVIIMALLNELGKDEIIFKKKDLIKIKDNNLGLNAYEEKGKVIVRKINPDNLTHDDIKEMLNHLLNDLKELVEDDK